MSRFNLSSQSNPCPICQDAKGRCRQKPEDLLYWQCMGFSGTRKGDTIEGFKCLGATKCGTWGQFRLQDGEYKPERKPSPQPQPEKPKEKLKARELDAAIRKLHGHFGLSQKHRAELRSRGLTDEAIDNLLYFTIQPNEKLPHGIPLGLPGTRNGEIKAAGSGYACVAFGSNGLALSWQIRLDGATENKYRWASNPHLSNGELPITKVGEIEPGEEIWACEGISKAAIASYRIGKCFIGAASANFTIATEQTKKHLEGASRVVFAPDAGALSNPAILRFYRRSWELFTQLGYEVKVAWWGQFDKSSPDIDELDLSDFQAIQFLSIEEFEALPRESENTSQEEIDPKISVTRKSQKQLLKIFDALKSAEGKEWLDRRKFTPDVVINSRYFNYNSEQGKNLAIQSGLGTGKTYHVHNHFLADDSLGAVAIGYRNTLLTQFTERGKNWRHLQTDLKEDRDSLKLIADTNSRISACADSLPYFQPQDFEGKAVIFDEVEGTIKHLYQSSTAVSLYRKLCKDRVAQSIASAASSILLDGNLTDATVAHLEALSGQKFLKIKNEFKGNRGRVYFFLGSEDSKDTSTETKPSKKTNSRDYAWLHRKVICDRERFLIASDSKEKLEAWEKQLTEVGKKCFRLDSSNSGTAEAQDFLADPAAWILRNQIDVLLFSPSAESGLSIDLKGYFKRQYFFFFGTVSTNEQTQFLGRLRDPSADIYCYCASKGMRAKGARGELDPATALTKEGLKQACAELAQLCWEATAAGTPADDPVFTERALRIIQGGVSDPHYQHECLLLATELFEQNNLRNCLEYALRDAGYEVLSFTVRSGDDKEDLKKAQEEIRERNSQEIYQSPASTEEEVQQILKKSEVTREEKTKVQKHKLLKSLPGIENKVITKTVSLRVTPEERQQIEQGNFEAIAEKLPPTVTKITLQRDPETQTGQGSEGDPQAAENYINNENTACGSGQVSEEGTVQLEIESAVLSPNLIKKIKFEKRHLLGQLEQFYLLSNPHLSHLLQQERWYKRIADDVEIAEGSSRKGKSFLNLSTYKSDWLRVKTLLDMGISFFLSPDAAWTKDSPELLEFWEKGKGKDRFTRIKWERNPIKYLGKVLESLDVKTTAKQSRAANERVRTYTLNQDYLTTPERQALLSCVEERLKERAEKARENTNWEYLKTQIQQESEGVTQAASNFINNNHVACVTDEAREGGTPQPIAELVEAFEFCTEDYQFALVSEDYEPGDVEVAISLIDSAPLRHRVRAWWEATEIGARASYQSLGMVT